MSGIFSDDTPAAAPISKPTTVPAAPKRTSDETTSLSAQQRARYNGPGSFTHNFFTGGQNMGDMSTVTRRLGGGV